MIKDILDNKKGFKLICGAGNEDSEQIKKLVALYSKAGCHFFDLSANKDVLIAAKEGLDFSIPKDEQKDYHFCISVGTKNDQHMRKAKIDPQKCKKCGVCIAVCPQNAVNPDFQIIEAHCIGCFRCKASCSFSAIDGYSKNKPIDLSAYEHINLSCIELHASDEDEKEVEEKWKYLNENFEGMLSLCIGRYKLCNEQILSRIKKLIKNREPYSTTIQTDGSSMSGGEDDFKTTLQAIAMAEFVQSSNLPVYIIPSGGANSKTAELAKLCGVNINGVAVGSYARKIVAEYIKREDFLTNNEVFEKATKIASNLVKKLTNFN